MGDWLSGLWSSVSDTAGDIWSSVSGTAGDVWGSVTGIFGDEGIPADESGGAFELPDFSSYDFGQMGDVVGGLFGSGPQAGPADVVLGSNNGMNGDDYGGQMVPVMGSAGGALAAGGVWLGSLLARAMGGAARGAIFTAANGVRVRMAQLWPLVRRYGAEAVAGGLGIGLGALGTLLSQPAALHGRSGRRGRGRGITARDVKTTRRTLKTIRKLYSMMPKRTVSWGGGGGYRRSYYRRRYR